MAIAVLADIHANLYAIEAVPAGIGKRDVERSICPGLWSVLSPFPMGSAQLSARENIGTMKE
ncbi:MAG TPA: hypothetical protein GX735_01400 [Firmicutes bacterium]|nr:hypothetical protein [Bacillota bacterium]